MMKAFHNAITKEIRFASTLREYPPPFLTNEKAIHEFRRRTKSIRALLDFYLPKHGRAVRLIRNEVADASRMLSTIRDARVIRNSLNDLMLRNQAEPVQTILKRAIAKQEEILSQSFEQNETSLLHGACGRLHEVLHSWDTISAKLSPSDIRSTLIETYREGRRATNRWLTKRQFDDMHKIRKVSKRLFTQLKFVRKMAGSIVNVPSLAVAERESKILGSSLGRLCDSELLLNRLCRCEVSADEKPIFNELQDRLQHRLTHDEELVTLRCCRFYFASPKSFLQGLSEKRSKELPFGNAPHLNIDANGGKPCSLDSGPDDRK